MVDIVFVPARSLIPLPPADAQLPGSPPADRQVGRGRHARVRAAVAQPRRQEPQTPAAARSERGPTGVDHHPDIPAFDLPAGQDAVAHAMDWLARLRGDGYLEPPDDNGRTAPTYDRGYAGRQADDGWAAAASMAAPTLVEPPWHIACKPADGAVDAPGGLSGCALTSAGFEATQRAVIGDELRVPIVWCELTPCISRYSDPQALGESDIRSRAIAAGWRMDALGRLTCPPCQQKDSRFWTTCPVTAWNRKRAVATAVLLAAGLPEDHKRIFQSRPRSPMS